MQIFHPHCNATHFNPKVVECPFQHDIVKDILQIYGRLLYDYPYLKLFLHKNIVVRVFSSHDKHPTLYRYDMYLNLVDHHLY